VRFLIAVVKSFTTITLAWSIGQCAHNYWS